MGWRDFKRDFCVGEKRGENPVKEQRRGEGSVDVIEKVQWQPSSVPGE